MSCEEGLYRTLRQRGMRVTPQREIVLSVLHDVEDHATVEEIHRRVQSRSSAINVSTVYRTLEMLQRMEMLGIVEGADGVRRYTLAHEHHRHAHMLCSRCGAVLDAAPDAIESLAASLREEHGFVLDRGHLTLPGLCPDCAAGRSARGQELPGSRATSTGEPAAPVPPVIRQVAPGA